MKNMQPPLSELSSVLFGEAPKPKFKQLCENIFDVPRSNLLDVLDDLQNAFWSDQLAEISPSPPIATTTDIIPTSLVDKQTTERQQDYFNAGRKHKRPHLMTDGTHDQQPTSPSPPSSPGRHFVTEPVYAKDSNKSLATAKNTHNNDISDTKDGLSPMDLWSVKWQLFKQLKSINHDYKEKQVIELWYSFQRQGTPTEIQHMARYLLPVACSMRRWTLADAFRQVLIT